jgi:hypothetical protein
VNAERSAEETADGNYYEMVGRLLQVDKNNIIIKLKCTLRDQTTVNVGSPFFMNCIPGASMIFRSFSVQSTRQRDMAIKRSALYCDS